MISTMGQICDSNVSDNPEARFRKAAPFLAVQRLPTARLSTHEKPWNAEQSQTNHRQLDTVTQSLLACMLASELTDGSGVHLRQSVPPASRRPAGSFPPSSSNCHAFGKHAKWTESVPQNVFNCGFPAHLPQLEHDLPLFFPLMRSFQSELH